MLASIDTDKTDMSPERRFLPARAADRDFAMSWVRNHGSGRVFYTSFGHNARLFWNAAMLGHVLAGTQFALGDLEADGAGALEQRRPAEGQVDVAKKQKWWRHAR